MIKHDLKLEQVIENIKRKISLEEKHIEKIIELYNNTTKSINRYDLKKIICFIENDLDDWKYRLENIPHKDGSSKKALILRYGETKGLEKYKEKQEKNCFTKEKFIEKYSEEKYKIFAKSRKVNTLEYWTEKYGNEIGLLKFSEYSEKRVKTFKENSKNRDRDTCSLNFYYKKYGNMDIACEKYILNKNSKYRRYKEEYWIEKYGKELGSQK